MVMKKVELYISKVTPHVKTRGFFNSPFLDVLEYTGHSCTKVLAFVASVLPAVSIILPEALVYMTCLGLGRESFWQVFFQRSPLPIQHLCASFDKASGAWANCTRELQKNMLDIMKYNATFKGCTLPSATSFSKQGCSRHIFIVL